MLTCCVFLTKLTLITITYHNQPINRLIVILYFMKIDNCQYPIIVIIAQPYLPVSLFLWQLLRKSIHTYNFQVTAMEQTA